MRNNKFYIEDGEFEKRLVVTAKWDKTIEKYMKDKKIKELHLNSARGWAEEYPDFLRNLPELIGIKISTFHIEDFFPINELHNLRSLSFGDYDKTKVDFKNFPKLEKCFFYWLPSRKSIFECTSLKELYIYGFREKDTEGIAKLKNLELLSLGPASTEDLRGIGKLPKLKKVELGYLSKLESLAGIEKLKALTYLRLASCKKIQNIDEVAKLTNLENFFLSNCGKIESLKPLRKLKKLKKVFFIEDTNIEDGDLSPLVGKKGLEVAFMDRRHYSHRMDEFDPGHSERIKKILGG